MPAINQLFYNGLKHSLLEKSLTRPARESAASGSLLILDGPDFRKYGNNRHNQSFLE
jgi:hypothetical protein